MGKKNIFKFKISPDFPACPALAVFVCIFAKNSARRGTFHTCSLPCVCVCDCVCVCASSASVLV